MTIQEAIKSGKPFKRRKRKSVFWTVEEKRMVLHLFIGKNAGWCRFNDNFSIPDILATDWETKPD